MAVVIILLDVIIKTIDLIYIIILLTFVIEKWKRNIIIKINRYENKEFNRIRRWEIKTISWAFEWFIGKLSVVLSEHAKFEEYYNDAIEKIDEIAERVLTLEGTPLHAYSAYMKVAEIKEVTGVSNGLECVKHIMDSLVILIRKEREILALAAEAGDDGTQDMINPYISEQEKTLWMLRAFLSE